MEKIITKLFLRFAISLGFLSAVADRFGLWNKEYSVWGNWNSFLEYTDGKSLDFKFISLSVAIVATVAEIILALFLIFGFKTELCAKLSGFLMLRFALSMTFSTGVKSALDYSVFSASAAAFGLSLMKEKYLELDSLLSNRVPESA